MKSTRRVVAATPVTVGDVEVTPLLRVREVSLGSRSGGFGFSSVRPEALEVHRGTRPSQVIPIRDVRPWVALAGLAVTVVLVATRRRGDD